MTKPHLSLRALFGIVAFLSVGCAAPMKPSFLWASILWTCTMAVLGAALVAIVCRRGQSRAFWVGFSVFGWGHMIFALSPWFADHTGEFIFTRSLVDRLGHALGHSVVDIPSTPSIWSTFSDLPFHEPGATQTANFPYLTYIVSGQSLFTLLIALAGGYWARHLYVTRSHSDVAA